MCVCIHVCGYLLLSFFISLRGSNYAFSQQLMMELPFCASHDARHCEDSKKIEYLLLKKYHSTHHLYFLICKWTCG